MRVDAEYIRIGRYDLDRETPPGFPFPLHVSVLTRPIILRKAWSGMLYG